jgi:sarcosine oxidase
MQAFVDRHLGGQLVRAVETKTCLYTLTPDRDFIVDRLPEAPGVIVALGAAHAYKFAALLGQILADLALDGRRGPPSAQLELFALDRPGLAPAPTDIRVA